MIRKHENSLAFKAGLLALVVHLMFFLVLVMSFDWKSEMPLQVTEVELWDSLPTPQNVPTPPPAPEPPKPEPEPKIEPAPEPPPPLPEPKAEIVVKEKKPEPKPEPEKKKVEPPKPDPAIKKKEEELKKKAEEKKRQQEILRKLQQMDDELAEKSLSEDMQRMEAARNAEQAQRAAAASSGEVDEYRTRIRNKIFSWMNRQSCGSAVPEYSISVMPTGQVAGTPKLLKSSGIPACDDAALRAIMQAQPLPLPPDPELFANFRDLRIPFKPEQ
jgi:colicin import membrane protein